MCTQTDTTPLPAPPMCAPLRRRLIANILVAVDEPGSRPSFCDDFSKKGHMVGWEIIRMGVRRDAMVDARGGPCSTGAT